MPTRPRGVRGTRVPAQPNSAQLTEIAALIDAGTVKPVVSTVLPLRDAAQAHALAGGGHTRQDRPTGCRLVDSRSIVHAIGVPSRAALLIEHRRIAAGTISSRSAPSWPPV